MVPDSSRRKLLRALATAGAVGAAGCAGVTGSDDETTSSPTTTTTTTSSATTNATTERGVVPAESPEDAVRAAFAAVEAEDAAAFQARFHPVHPFHPDNLDREDARDIVDDSTDRENVTVERVDQAVTADLVESATLPGPDTARTEIADALSGSDAVVLAVTSDTESSTETVRFVTVEYDGGWLILAQGVPSSEQRATSSLAARVVGGVAFEPDRDAARVQFVADPVADSVTVEATSSGETATTDSPGSVTYLQVGLDPAGDEVVVRATLDGESRIVHRERYPETDRLVDEVRFDDDPDSARDAAARVTFDAENATGRIRVASTVHGGEAAAEPVESIDYLVVGIDPDGDEVVVTYPVDGDTEEIHRERYNPQ
jgi:hypothetical protein